MKAIHQPFWLKLIHKILHTRIHWGAIVSWWFICAFAYWIIYIALVYYFVFVQDNSIDKADAGRYVIIIGLNEKIVKNRRRR